MFLMQQIKKKISPIHFSYRFFLISVNSICLFRFPGITVKVSGRQRKPHRKYFQSSVLQVLLAFQKILQNSHTFDRYRERHFFVLFGDQK